MSIASTFEILQKWGINDNAIKERIYKKSNGHPLYIERLVEAYYQAFRNNEAFDEMSFIDKYSF
jgi:hypothetical protein